MSEEAELVELIEHKLRFVEGWPKVLGISDIHPLKFMNEDKWVKIVSSLGVEIKPTEGEVLLLPEETEILLVQINYLDIARALTLLPDFVAIPGWADTLAVQQQKVFLMDDQFFQNSTRTMQIEILAEIIHPKLFAFGHEGTAWIKLNF